MYKPKPDPFDKRTDEQKKRDEMISERAGRQTDCWHPYKSEIEDMLKPKEPIKLKLKIYKQ